MAKDSDEPATSFDGSSSVQVAIRVRPFLPTEAGSTRCVDVLASNTGADSSVVGMRSLQHQRVVRIGGESGPTFTFDAALPGHTSQRQVYASCVAPLVHACLRGYNATVLAYGQTGSGKTHTILGPSSGAALQDEASHGEGHNGMSGSVSNGDLSEEDDVSAAGVIPRALRELFGRLEELKRNAMSEVAESGGWSDVGGDGTTSGESDQGSASSTPFSSRPSTPLQKKTPFEYEVRVQFLELYGEEVRDLLSRGEHQRLAIRDGGAGVEPEVIGATETRVSSAEEALLCLTRGTLRRVTGATAMNAESSRSHAIMSVVVEQTTTTFSGGGSEEMDVADSDGDGGDGLPPDMEVEVKRSKFHFVDLAGSERQKRSLAEGKRLKEGIDINKGLLVLGNVISALGDPKKRGKTFVPYRDSKLTRLLKGSLGGNHKTLMIACVSPSSSNLEESLNCLRYANRAKNIQNNAVVNVDAGSRMVAELRGQVKALATELLRVQQEEGVPSTGPFTAELLKSLSSGSDSSGLKVSVAAAADQSSNSRGFGSADVTAVSRSQMEELLQAQQRSNYADVEINRMREKLEETKSELYTISEALYAAKAEREYYRLRVPGEDLIDGGEDDGGPSQREADEQKGGDDTAADEKRSETCISREDSKDAFVAKISAYERELACLRDTVRDLRSGAMSSPAQRLDESSLSSVSSEVRARPYAPRMSVIDRANEVIEIEKSHLNNLQQAIKEGKKVDEEEEEEAHEKGAISGENDTHANDLHEEEVAAQKELQSITDKYLQDSDDEHDEHEEEGKGNLTEAQHSTTSDEYDIGPSDVAAVELKDEAFNRRQKHMDAHLIELSKSIAAKEELIEQLHLSQDRYETMKDFYEEKLAQMEEQLSAREAEREHLIDELHKLEEDSHHYHDLKNALQAKERHIADLRKKQLELRSLTKVSSRNETVVTRLREDIAAMKRQKVELQRQMTSDRKAHQEEVQQLKKQAIQRDREASKWKQVSDRTKAQAETAQRMAKSRAEEIGKLRSKYREAEKKLRMQTLKRGVMQRAGLDAVMVGRREAGRPSSARSQGSALSTQKRKNQPLGDGDADKIRSFFDEKVADVGRKEAAADKLAHEWEDHLELALRKEDLLTEMEEDGKDQSRDEVEALNIQIRYKEGRIRQLTRRLGSKPSKKTQLSSLSHNTLLEDREFKALCGGASALAAAQAASKILFGMVVRERRRVAALARTASSLDQKALEAENLAASKDAALRSHMEEQRHERATMAQSQQEQILSLMALVRDEEEKSVSSRGTRDTAASGDAAEQEILDERGKSLSAFKNSAASESMVTILANERVAVLEMQLSELQGEREAKEGYKTKMLESEAALSDKREECEELQRELKQLRSSLRQIRENLLNIPGEQLFGEFKNKDRRDSEDSGDLDDLLRDESENDQSIQNIKNIIRDALHPATKTPPRKAGSRNRRQLERKKSRGDSTVPFISPSIKRHVELMHTSDSEGDEELPDWAGDIMADLAMIAEGEMPPSLKKKKKGSFRRSASNTSSHSINLIQGGPHSKDSNHVNMHSLGGGNVFERLTDPGNFTGVHKNIQTGLDRHQRNSNESAEQMLNEIIEPASHVDSDPSARDKPCTINITSPSSSFDSTAEGGKGSTPSSRTQSSHRSVFERLQSPSYYTGTQKNAFDSAQPVRYRKGESVRSQDSSAHSDAATLAVAATGNESPQASDKAAGSEAQSSSSREWVTEYTQQDVFERLQKKVTQSYALSHPQAESESAQHQDSSLQHEPAVSSHESPTDSFSSSMKGGNAISISTPTPAQVKHHGVAEEKTGSSETMSSTSRKWVKEYTQQDVFERLQKKVTQSYAVKHNPDREE